MHIYVRLEFGNRKEATDYVSALLDRGWSLAPDRDSKANEVTVRCGLQILPQLSTDLCEIYGSRPAVTPPIHKIAPVSPLSPRASDHF